MSKQVRWLFAEVDAWVSRGLVSPQQAEDIRKSYPEPKPALAWGTILFSGLGAAVAGLGIILLFAYNWHQMPKAAKLALIFGFLAAAHGTGIWLFQQPDRRRQLGEALCLLGSMLFGAGIWLIAQIYHIDEHFPTGFFIWGIGTLLMGWALPSLAHGFLATVLLAIWSCNEALEFSTPKLWGPLLLLFGVGGLAWRHQSRALLFAVLGGFALTSLCDVGGFKAQLVFRAALNLAVLFVAVGILVQQYDSFPESAPIWNFFGWSGFLLCLYLLTFPGIVDDLIVVKTADGPAAYRLAYVYSPPVLALGAWGLVALNIFGSRRAQREDCPYENWFLPFVSVLVVVLAFAQPGMHRWIGAGIFNLVLLGLTAAWMARGSQDGSLRYTLLGSLSLVALVLARYFDLFESLMVRGILFLLLGAVLFVEGILFRRARRQAKTAEAP